MRYSIHSTPHSLLFDITTAAGVSCPTYSFSSRANLQQINSKHWVSSRPMQANLHPLPALIRPPTSRSRTSPPPQNGHYRHRTAATRSNLTFLSQLRQTVLLQMMRHKRSETTRTITPPKHPPPPTRTNPRSKTLITARAMQKQPQQKLQTTTTTQIRKAQQLPRMHLH